MVDSQILLSIIIPAFNAENYIEKCINRIVPLLDCDVECIVVDDGSTDNTLKLLRNISNDIVNINIIYSKCIFHMSHSIKNCLTAVSHCIFHK